MRWARSRPGGAGETVVYAWLSLDDDRDAAAEALRPQVEAWRSMNLYPRLFELAGVDEGLDADRLRGLAVAGDADDCARAVAALWDAGADSVVVVPRHEDRGSQVARFVAMCCRGCGSAAERQLRLGGEAVDRPVALPSAGFVP